MQALLYYTHAHGKRGYGTRRIFISTDHCLLIFSAPAFAGSSEAVGKVRKGLPNSRAAISRPRPRRFRRPKRRMPNELKIAFDRGCAYAAGGEYDKAVEQFQKAAAASDHKLAALAHYNLGSVAVAKAKTKLGEKPEEAEGDARTAALELLAGAAKHYRDCLSIDADNSDARYNLETIRLWIKHIQDVWQQRDRQKRRDAMNLLEYLDWLESEQRALRQSNKELGSAKPSPRQREAVRAVENAQRTLAEEIQPLKEKIASSFIRSATTAGKNAAASPSADVQKAIEVLDRLADEVASVDEQSGRFACRRVVARGRQVAIPGRGNDRPDLHGRCAVCQLGAAGHRQAGRIDQSIARRGKAREIGRNKTLRPISDIAQADASAAFDGNEAAWNQRFIARYGRILSAKARRELEQLNSMPAAKQEPPEQSATSSTPDANAAPARTKIKPVRTSD